jgi:parallel beta-helix repeat protein
MRDVFVATSGSDQNVGTLAQPFRTVQAALASLPIGQGGNVFLRGGSYLLDDDITIENAEGGTADSRLVIRNYENEKVIIDGSRLDALKSPAIILNSTRAVDIQGLEITGSYGGINVIGSSNDISIRNNIVRDVGFTGIGAFGAELGGIQNVRVDGNTVFRTNLFNRDRPVDQPTGWGSGIVFSLTNGGSITNNLVYENYGEGISVTLANGATASGNTVYDSFSVGMYMDNVTNSVFDRNFIYSTGNREFFRRFADGKEVAATGIQLANENYPLTEFRFAVSNPLDSNIISNNIVVGGERVFGYGNFENGGGLKNVQIINNTFYGNSTTDTVFTIDPDSHENTIIFNNLIYKESAEQEPDVRSSAGLFFANNLWFGGPAGPAGSTTDVTANPLLANPGGFRATDYQLLAGSPAIDKGIANNAPTQDFAGAARPANLAVDIGAFEFGNPPPPITLPTPPIIAPGTPSVPLVSPDPTPPIPPVTSAPPTLSAPPITPEQPPASPAPPITLESPAPQPIATPPERICKVIPSPVCKPAKHKPQKRFKHLDLQDFKQWQQRC